MAEKVLIVDDDVQTLRVRLCDGSGYSARLVSIDITGFNERAIPTPTDGSDPAWSPLLP